MDNLTKTAEWRWAEGDGDYNAYICSNCEEVVFYDDEQYCPNCKAKMINYHEDYK